MIRAVIAWGPAATWATVLFLLSELRVIPWITWFAVHDKVVHLILYGILGAALAWGKRMSGTRIPHWVLVVGGVAYALADELHQRFVPARLPSAGDLLADAVGLVAGYAALLGLWLATSRATSQPCC